MESSSIVFFWEPSLSDQSSHLLSEALSALPLCWSLHVLSLLAVCSWPEGPRSWERRRHYRINWLTQVSLGGLRSKSRTIGNNSLPPGVTLFHSYLVTSLETRSNSLIILLCHSWLLTYRAAFSASANIMEPWKRAKRIISWINSNVCLPFKLLLYAAMKRGIISVWEQASSQYDQFTNLEKKSLTLKYTFWLP